MSVATTSPPSQQEAEAPSQQATDGRDICEPGRVSDVEWGFTGASAVLQIALLRRGCHWGLP